MNKKFLKMLFGMCILLMFIFYIGAEENLSNSKEITLPQEESLPVQAQIENIVYENLDTLTEENASNEKIIEENISEEIVEEEPIVTENDNQEIIIEEENNSEQQEDACSGSSSQENQIEYVELSNVTQEIPIEEPEIEREKTEYIYYNNGKKEIEIETYERVEITKEEVEKGEFEKEITISSEEHVEDPLRVYTDLTTEAERENIKIYWKNENNLEITDENEFAVEYYDENSNGLVDRISWMVPHLSEQIFDVVIEINRTNDSAFILLNAVGPSGQTRNPVNFTVNVNHAGNLNCFLDINGSKSNPFANDFNYSLLLQNGTYTWYVNCSNNDDPSITNITETKMFIINEGIYQNNLQEGRVYLLDLVKNIINNSNTIGVGSLTTPSNFVVKIFKDGTINYTASFSDSTTIVMDRTKLISSGRYNLSVEFDEPSPRITNITNFSVASANIVLNTTSIKEGDSINININIISPIKQIYPLNLNYGDGSSFALSPTGTYSVNQNYVHKYINEGTYYVTLSFLIGTEVFSIQKSLTVTDFNDNEDPNINLLWPKDEKIIYEDYVNFSYEASDNAKLKNCTFKLYENCASMSWCSTSSSNLAYSTTQSNPANDDEIEVNLKDFDEGFYEWLVECYDNSSNYEWEAAFFKIDLNGTASLDSSSEDYEQKEEVLALKEEVDTFLEEDFSLEELEALNDLNILEDIKYYKKRLINIDISLAGGFPAYSEELREKKTEEYLEEFESIQNKIPQGITVKDNYEYIKNSVEVDFNEIIQDYFYATNTDLGRVSTQKLARFNEELQNELSVSAKIRNVEIEYKNGTQRMTLVKKAINMDNDDYSIILEVIPKEIAEKAEEIIFVTDSEIIKDDPIFEVNYEDLDKKEIVYYLNRQVKLESFEKTETLLFEDDLGKLGSKVTGFFVFDFGSSDFGLYFLLFFILLIVLLFVTIIVVKKFRMLSWRKEPNVVRVMNLLEEINKFLAEKEVEKAREKYYKIKEIYPVLPYNTKLYFYNKINEMLIRIDRKDIFGLVKEYQEAKRNWNKEDYIRLYKDIRKIYERLPEKDRKKVYDIINGY